MKKQALQLQAILLTNNEPLSSKNLQQLLVLSPDKMNDVLDELHKICKNQAFELVETASGFSLQIKQEFVSLIKQNKEQTILKHSRAFLETLAIIAYFGPITRAEIEHKRGVATSSDILKKLFDLEWVETKGFKDIPGKPEMLATTKKFLDDYSLKSLGDLPNIEDVNLTPKIQQNAVIQLEIEDRPITNFKTLLEELENMEIDLKTDFTNDEQQEKL